MGSGPDRTPSREALGRLQVAVGDACELAGESGTQCSTAPAMGSTVKDQMLAT